MKPIKLMPRVQRKPYTPEKQKRGKAMTIAVGFLCGNGEHLILAADRQITLHGAYKIRRKKYATSKQKWVQLTCLFSGEPGVFSEFIQKVEDDLKTESNATPEIVKKTIEKKLDEMRLRGSNADPCFWLLIGISDFFESLDLLVFDGKSLFEAANSVHVIGCGDTSLIHYLGDQLYRPDMTKDQGIALGAYLIKKATEYVDGCGEPIDVIHGCIAGFSIVKETVVSSGIQKIQDQEELLFTWLVQTPFRS